MVGNPYTDPTLAREVQANVLSATRLPCARLICLSFGSKAAAKRWLKTTAPQVSYAADSARFRANPKDFGPQRMAPVEVGTLLTVAITAHGLRQLGVADAWMERFPAPFTQGMRARAEILHDYDSSAPEHWDAGFRDGETGALVTLHASAEALLERTAEAYLKSVGAGGSGAIRVVHSEDGGMLPGSREHFGYTDGISNPKVRFPPDRFTGPTPSPRPAPWDEPLNLGELLLGYRGEGVAWRPPALNGPLATNSTFLVYRKLRQHVGAFHDSLDGKARALGLDPDLLKSCVVGRWPNGAPLVDHPQAEPRLNSPPDNGFTYEKDPDAKACPFGAHARRCNPRDRMKPDQRTHRLFRRGIPYGPPCRDRDGDDVDRGMLFVVVGTDIERQFEFVQQQWVNSANFLWLASGEKDALVGAQRGDASTWFTTQTPGGVGRKWYDAPRVDGLPRFVDTRGGGYFFVPSRTALQGLLDGRFAGDPEAPGVGGGYG